MKQPFPRRGRQRAIRRRLRLFGLTGLLLAWMALHYAVVGLHLLPRNAITILHPEFVHRYVQPFFAQDWHLFAPKPPISNEWCEIQLRLEPIGPGAGEPRLTRWFDVTTPLQKRIWANPLSAEVTRLRTIDGINGQYRTFLARRAAYPDYATYPEAALDADAYERLVLTLAREVYDPSRFRLLAVRGRTLIREVPPFSEYENPNFKPKTLKSITSDWFLAPGADPGR